MVFVALASLLLAAPVVPVSDTDGVRVQIDSAKHQVVLRAGPFTIAGNHGDPHGGGHAMAHDPGLELPLLRFTWPNDGWLRGVKLRLVDGKGKPLDRRLVHHVNIVNFGRRALFYPVAERMLALGQETEDIRLPATVGIPVSAKLPMGMILAWHNPGHEAIPGVQVELTFEYSPTNLFPKPVSVLPVYLDVQDPVGRDVDFDLPAGTTKHTADFRATVAGRILGAGGHLHDYGTGLLLQEVNGAATKDLISLRTVLDKQGALLKVDRAMPGAMGDGTRITPGKTYRLTGTYQNPTGKPIAKGAMVHMVVLYAPDRMEDWPKIEPNDPGYRRDLARLQARGNKRDDGM